MSDERTDASAAFGLRLSADLLTALVVTGKLPKAYATALVDDCLRELLASHPDREQQLREIAATLISQVSLVSIEVDRKTR